MIEKMFMYIFIFSLFIVNVHAESLYAISGCPTPLSPATYGSDLYRLEISSDGSTAWLEKKVSLIPGSLGSFFIQSYPDVGVVSLKWEGYYPGSRYTVVDMKSPLSPKTFTFSHDTKSTFLRGWILDIPKKGLYQVIQIFKDKKESLLGINLETLVEEIIDYEELSHAVLSGSPGVALPGDFIEFHLDRDSELFFCSHQIHRPFPKYEALLPVQGKQTKYIGVYLMNHDLIAVQGQREIDSTEFYVFDQKNKTWKDYHFPGDLSIKLRCFGPWIGGYECSLKKEKSPEADQWEDETKKYLSANRRLKSSGLYCPGNLFFYNVQTDEQFEIKTGQGDSEVLLIHDNTIYYRVYNRIYQTQIEEGKLGKSTLLLQSEDVPNIHWLFSSQEE